MLESHSQKFNRVDATSEKNPDRLLRNSDRIQIKFGNYNIDIIENTSRIRVSKLYSTYQGLKTNRTFAVVAYPEVVDTAFAKEHKAIIDGQSIGVVFELNGWTIDKHHLYFGEIEVPADDSGSHSLFGVNTPRPAMHIYSLVVRKDNASFVYALIAEIHHPEFLQLSDLKAIYGHDNTDTPQDSRIVHDFLGIVRNKIQSL